MKTYAPRRDRSIPKRVKSSNAGGAQDQKRGDRGTKPAIFSPYSTRLQAVLITAGPRLSHCRNRSTSTGSIFRPSVNLELNMNMKFAAPFPKSFIYMSAVAVCAVLPGFVRAAEPDYGHHERFVCTNETLKGDYGFTITGIRPTGPGTPQVAVVGTALTTFHGDGTLDRFDNINVNSPAVPYQVDRKGTGTYDLQPNCSGTMTLTGGGTTLALSIVVVDHGREVRTAVVTPNVIVTSNGRKIE
jgi:hypothetical protein